MDNNISVILNFIEDKKQECDDNEYKVAIEALMTLRKKIIVLKNFVIRCSYSYLSYNRSKDLIEPCVLVKNYLITIESDDDDILITDEMDYKHFLEDNKLPRNLFFKALIYNNAIGMNVRPKFRKASIFRINYEDDYDYETETVSSGDEDEYELEIS